MGAWLAEGPRPDRTGPSGCAQRPAEVSTGPSQQSSCSRWDCVCLSNQRTHGTCRRAAVPARTRWGRCPVASSVRDQWHVEGGHPRVPRLRFRPLAPPLPGSRTWARSLNARASAPPGCKRRDHDPGAEAAEGVRAQRLLAAALVVTTLTTPGSHTHHGGQTGASPQPASPLVPQGSRCKPTLHGAGHAYDTLGPRGTQAPAASAGWGLTVDPGSQG